jgi:integrase
MARAFAGSVYRSRASWYLALSILGKRRHFRLATCPTEELARERSELLVGIVRRLREAGKEGFAEATCRQAADANDQGLINIGKLLEGILAGTEHKAPPKRRTDPTITIRKFGARWTSNELAAEYRGRLRPLDHAKNISRLKKHVYPVHFDGRAIGDTPLSEFTLDHADHLLAQPTLPAGSLRQVAQVIRRLFRLAVYPARILAQSPFPEGWLPPPNAQKERAYLFPSEDAALMAHTRLPLVKRLLIGFCTREGPRKDNAVTIEWSNLTLDLPDGGGYVVLDTTKNGSGASWALDPGTAEALRRWRPLCPSSRYVFPSPAVPRKVDRGVRPLSVGHLGAELRTALLEAGVTRPKLFERSERRLPLRAHDLRASFVTLALATGRTEDWVVTRTGHRSSAMVAKYRREARTIEELKLGWFRPLHEVIPELSKLAPATNR